MGKRLYRLPTRNLTSIGGPAKRRLEARRGIYAYGRDEAFAPSQRLICGKMLGIVAEFKRYGWGECLHEIHLRIMEWLGNHKAITNLRNHKKPKMKFSEILRLLVEDGWFLVATQGSHRQFKHSTKSGRVTVPGKPSDDLAPGTLNSILKQSQLKR